LAEILAQSLVDGFGLDIRGEAVLIFLLSDILQYVFIFLCHYARNIVQRYKINSHFHNAAEQIWVQSGQNGKKAG